MKQWEYKLITSQDLPRHGFLGTKGPDREELEPYLNQLGVEGWEIVNLDFVDANTVIPMWTFRGLAKRATT